MSRKSASVIGNAIIWGCAIIAVSVCLSVEAPPGVMIAILAGSAGGSLIVAGAEHDDSSEADPADDSDAATR